jgi:hypothetical protein
LNPDAAGVASAVRELAASSEDPGVFTLGASIPWITTTLAIRPEAAPPSTSLAVSSIAAASAVGSPSVSVGDIDIFRFSAALPANREVLQEITLMVDLAEHLGFTISADTSDPDTFVIEASTVGVPTANQELLRQLVESLTDTPIIGVEVTVEES